MAKKGPISVLQSLLYDPRLKILDGQNGKILIYRSNPYENWLNPTGPIPSKNVNFCEKLKLLKMLQYHFFSPLA